MERPAAASLEADVPCAPGLNGADALSACARAAEATGFRVVLRTRSSVTLLPVPKRGLAWCVLPGFHPSLALSTRVYPSLP